MKRNFILEKIFNPKRPLYELIPESDEYAEQQKKFFALDEDLRKKLEEYPTLTKLYDSVSLERDYLSVLSSDDYYMEGFRVGFMLAVDLFDEGKSPF